MEAEQQPNQLKQDTEAALQKQPDKLKRIVEKLGMFVMKQRAQRKEEPNQITEHIFLGSYSAACNEQFLEKEQIRNILMCFGHLPQPFPSKFKYMQIDVKGISKINSDRDEEDIRLHFQSSYDFIEEAVANNQRILVHCFAGISRSTTILAAYLIRKHGKPLREVLQLIRQKRSTVRPNPGFLRQLEEFQREHFAAKEVVQVKEPPAKVEQPIESPEEPKQEHPQPEPGPIPKQEADEGISEPKGTEQPKADEAVERKEQPAEVIEKAVEPETPAQAVPDEPQVAPTAQVPNTQQAPDVPAEKETKTIIESVAEPTTEESKVEAPLPSEEKVQPETKVEQIIEKKEVETESLPKLEESAVSSVLDPTEEQPKQEKPREEKIVEPEVTAEDLEKKEQQQEAEATEATEKKKKNQK